MISNSQINEDRCNEVTTVWCIARHRGSKPNKDKPLVDLHATLSSKIIQPINQQNKLGV